MQVVPVHNHLNQLHGHNNRKDYTGNGDHDVFRERVNHVENVRVPALGRLSDLAGNI